MTTIRYQETHDHIMHAFGEGYREAGKGTAEDRALAGYDRLADTIRRRLESMAQDNDFGDTESDFIRAILESLTDHDWRMLAINLFNATTQEGEPQ